MKLPHRVRRVELYLKISTLLLFISNILILFIVFIMNTKFFIERTTLDSLLNIPPVVVLNGSESIRIPLGEDYADPGAEAYAVGGDPDLLTEGKVDSSVEGVYMLHYTACNQRDNCTTVKRKVTVIKPAGTVYLTFDDGPGEYTGRLLDVLKKYDVHATFFVTGRGTDEILKREHDEGHAIGLHSFSHDYSYIYRNTANFWADMEKVRARVKTATGEDTLLMRFPGGSSNTVSARYDGGSHIMSKLTKEAIERGYTYFDWNVLSGDAGETIDTNQIIENVTKGLKLGGASVVLQHDIKDFSVDAVERIIQFGLENNYLFEKLTPNSFNAHHGVNN